MEDSKNDDSKCFTNSLFRDLPMWLSGLLVITSLVAILKLLLSIVVVVSDHSFTKMKSDEFLIPSLIVLIGVFLSWVFWKKESTRNIIPTLWTSLGILGTFISLYIAFSGFATKDISSNDIGGLVVILSTAFSTSIIGVFLSQVFNYLINNLEHKRSLDVECYKVSPEQMLMELRNASLLQLEQQKAMCKSLEGMHTHLSSIDGKIDTKVGELASEFGSTMDQIKSVLIDDTKGIRDSLLKSSESINDDMLKSIDSQMKKMEAVVAHTSEILDDLGKSSVSRTDELFEKLMYDFGSSVCMLNDTLEKQLLEMNSQIKESVSTGLNDNVSEVKKVADEVVSVSNDIKTEFTNSIDTMVKHSSEVYNQLENQSSEVLSKLSEISNQSSKDITLKTKDLLDGLEKGFGDILNEAKSWTDINDAALSTVSDRLKGSVQMFDKYGVSHEGIIDKLETQIKLLQLAHNNMENLLGKFNLYETKSEMKLIKEPIEVEPSVN